MNDITKCALLSPVDYMTSVQDSTDTRTCWFGETRLCNLRNKTLAIESSLVYFLQ